jgi:hypothetical protein
MVPISGTRRPIQSRLCIICHGYHLQRSACAWGGGVASPTPQLIYSDSGNYLAKTTLRGSLKSSLLWSPNKPCWPTAMNKIYHGGRWSNRTQRVPARPWLLSTCVMFWSLRRRVVEYTPAKFSPESMYITTDSSASTSYPSLKRHKCIWWFGKATGLHELSSFLISQ